MRDSLWKSRSPAEKFWHTIGANMSEIGHIEEGKRNKNKLSLTNSFATYHFCDLKTMG